MNRSGTGTGDSDAKQLNLPPQATFLSPEHNNNSNEGLTMRTEQLRISEDEEEDLVSVSNQSENGQNSGLAAKKSDSFHNHPKATKTAMNQHFRNV